MYLLILVFQPTANKCMNGISVTLTVKRVEGIGVFPNVKTFAAVLEIVGAPCSQRTKNSDSEGDIVTWNEKFRYGLLPGNGFACQISLIDGTTMAILTQATLILPPSDINNNINKNKNYHLKALDAILVLKINLTKIPIQNSESENVVAPPIKKVSPKRERGRSTSVEQEVNEDYTAASILAEEVALLRAEVIDMKNVVLSTDNQRPQEQLRSQYCNKCGVVAESDARFCWDCGTELPLLARVTAAHRSVPHVKRSLSPVRVSGYSGFVDHHVWGSGSAPATLPLLPPPPPPPAALQSQYTSNERYVPVVNPPVVNPHVVNPTQGAINTAARLVHERRVGRHTPVINPTQSPTVNRLVDFHDEKPRGFPIHISIPDNVPAPVARLNASRILEREASIARSQLPRSSPSPPRSSSPRHFIASGYRGGTRTGLKPTPFGIHDASVEIIRNYR